MLVKINGKEFGLKKQKEGKKKTIWINEEELKHNEISIKHYNGSVTFGYVMPIVASFSSFNDKQIPKESFIVTDGLQITASTIMDARNMTKDIWF